MFELLRPLWLIGFSGCFKMESLLCPNRGKVEVGGTTHGPDLADAKQSIHLEEAGKAKETKEPMPTWHEAKKTEGGEEPEKSQSGDFGGERRREAAKAGDIKVLFHG